MIMDQDIQSQLDRAKELLQALEKACDDDLRAKDVSGKTKNLSQEVLLKVIISENSGELSPKFINNISNATNQQTKVDESDRRSNEDIQIRIQGLIFDNFGYYYERKKGEFHPGGYESYINKDLIIKRDNFVRAYYASKGFPSTAITFFNKMVTASSLTALKRFFKSARF